MIMIYLFVAICVSLIMPLSIYLNIQGLSPPLQVATARGGGGGLALWRRDPGAQEQMRPLADEEEV